MIPDFSETIAMIERDFPECCWLLRSDVGGAMSLAAGSPRYFCNITPPSWRTRDGKIDMVKAKLYPSAQATGNTASEAAFLAYETAKTLWVIKSQNN